MVPVRLGFRRSFVAGAGVPRGVAPAGRGGEAVRERRTGKEGAEHGGGRLCAGWGGGVHTQAHTHQQALQAKTCQE